MRIVSKSGLVALMAMAPMALASDAISAQEREQERQQMSQCTARVTSGQTAGVMGEEQQRQQQQQQQQQGLQSGQKASQVTLQLSSPIGNINDFKAEPRDAQTGEPITEEQREQRAQQDRGHELKLAEGDDLPQTQREMARTGEQENEAIQMSTQNTVTLWLNTEDASPGHYHFTLEGENGQCTGQIEVKGGAR